MDKFGIRLVYLEGEPTIKASKLARKTSPTSFMQNQKNAHVDEEYL